MNSRRPCIFGEVLFDRFPDGTAVLGGAPAEKTLTAWARANRYAGSGDRAAIRDVRGQRCCDRGVDSEQVEHVTESL